MKIKNQKIQIQLTIVFAVFFSAAALILYFVLNYEFKDSLNEKFEYKAGVFLSYFLINPDNIITGKISDKSKLAELAVMNRAYYIVITDKDGNSKDALNYKSAQKNNYTSIEEGITKRNGNYISKILLPLKLNNSLLGKIYIGFNANAEVELYNKTRMQILLFCLLIALVGIIFTYYLTLIFFKPLSKIITALKESSDTDSETEIKVTANNEIGILAEKISEVILKKNKSINENKKLRRELKETLREKLNELGVEIQNRKAAEEHLAVSERRFKLLFQNAPIPMASIDELGQIIEVNSAFRSLFSLTSENIQKLPISCFFPDELFMDFKNLNDVNSAIRLRRGFSFTNINSVQSDFIFESFVIHEKDVPKELVIQAMNITDLKRIQQDLVVALQKSEASEKLKEAFLAQMSHEIRTPLNVILTSIPLLIDEIANDDEELIIILDSVKSAGKRLQRTIDMILSLSAIESGNYTAKFDNFNLADDIKIIINELKTIANEKGLQIRLTGSELDAIINADRYSVNQIFQNLINNSIKYSNKGIIQITISHFNSKQLKVEIKDEGIGMSEEFIQKMFTPFSQEKIGHHREYDGNGLGLALVKKYVDLNDASISVESEKNKGTVFTVCFNKTPSKSISQAMVEEFELNKA